MAAPTDAPQARVSDGPGPALVIHIPIAKRTSATPAEECEENQHILVGAWHTQGHTRTSQVQRERGREGERGKETDGILPLWDQEWEP